MRARRVPVVMVPVVAWHIHLLDVAPAIEGGMPAEATDGGKHDATGAHGRPPATNVFNRVHACPASADLCVRLLVHLLPRNLLYERRVVARARVLSQLLAHPGADASPLVPNEAVQEVELLVLRAPWPPCVDITRDHIINQQDIGARTDLAFKALGWGEVKAHYGVVTVNLSAELHIGERRGGAHDRTALILGFTARREKAIRPVVH